jgi:hypothetical protein
MVSFRSIEAYSHLEDQNFSAFCHASTWLDEPGFRYGGGLGGTRLWRMETAITCRIHAANGVDWAALARLFQSM